MAMERALEMRESCDVYSVSDDAFPNDIIAIEDKFSQQLPGLKLGVIYCANGQTSPLEMFRNGMQPDKPAIKDSFWQWLNAMGQEIDLTTHQGYRGDMPAQGKTHASVWNKLNGTDPLPSILR